MNEPPAQLAALEAALVHAERHAAGVRDESPDGIARAMAESDHRKITRLLARVQARRMAIEAAG